MRKILIALMLSAGLHAGGSLPEVQYIEVETIQASPFYFGGGIGVDAEISRYYDTVYDYDIDEGYSNLSLLVGATIAREGNLGLAIEGRAAWSFDEYGVDSYGIYIKPEIETTKDFTVFGILGYQNLTTYDYDFNAIGVGVGGTYLFTDSVGVMVDYTYSVIEADEFGFVPEYANLTASILYRF